MATTIFERRLGFSSVFLTIALILFQHSVQCNGQEVSVRLGLGTITGFIKTFKFGADDHTAQQFLGIPFTEPMSAATRFQRAEPRRTPYNNYNATYYRPMCPQSQRVNPSVYRFILSEDCLHVNVHAPVNANDQGVSSKAVMVWVYGGAFIFGGADYYSGEVLSALYDVIVVTFNYRLAAFGFLSSGNETLPGNLGLWDQHLAIRWVHDNIQAFGGDPSRVTLFGESAGGASVLYQAMYPGNENLFQRVIAQSGSTLASWAFNTNPEALFGKVATDSGCVRDRAVDVLECLKTKDFTEISEMIPPLDSYSPVIDGEFLTEDPALILEGTSTDTSRSRQMFRNLDIISGINSKDGDSVIKMMSQLGMNLTNGITEYIFKEVLLPAGIGLAGLNNTPPLKASILHQYTNWNDPSDMLAIRDSVVDLNTDVLFLVPAVRVARAHASPGSTKNTYMYMYSYRFMYSMTPAWLDGAAHTEEIPFVFGFPDSLNAAVDLDPSIPVLIHPDELALSRRIMSYWTNFAKTGNPNEQQDDSWPKFTRTEQKYLDINAMDNVKSRMAASRVSFWVDVVPAIQNCSKTTVCEKCSTETSTGTSLQNGILLNVCLCVLIMLLS